MKCFVFPYSISFGKLDSAEGYLPYSLSDENARRLIRSAEDGGRHKLWEDPFISDLYHDVYQAVEKEQEKQLKKDPDPVKDALSWEDDYDHNKPITLRQIRKYIKELQISVYYPEELQLLETKVSSEKKISQYMVVDEKQAEELIKKDDYGNNIILLTDEGKTLYYVPLKFVGTVVIPSCVRSIRSSYSSGAIKGRKLVEEIIIEEGLPEIEEGVFAGCERLTKITIPCSVKKIGHHSFAGCSSLKSISLPEGVEEIYYSSFDNGCGIESIILPTTLKLMYKLDIKDIYFKGKNTIITEKLGCDWRRTVLHVLSGSEPEKYAIENGIRHVIMQNAER